MSSGQYIAKCNDSSRAASNRAKYIAENGGEFVKSGRKWLWHGETKSAPQPEPVAEVKTKTKKSIWN
tara:strand:+ start:405 stop:605 length:201 start_codon:yes stop_codon:yes gene_type:complete